MSQSFECFSFLAEKTPSWAQDVEELQRRIAECQKEVAKLANPVVKKLRKSGSNESIRPGKEEEEVQLVDEPEDLKKEVEGLPTAQPSVEQSPATQKCVPPSSPKMNQTQPRLNKRKTASIASNASGTPKIRTRSMIVVYYDSVVQHAFEQLVKQISMGRNHIRRAKQAETMNRLTRSLHPEPKQPKQPNGDSSLMPRVDLGATPSAEGTSVPPFRSTRSPIPPRNGERNKLSSTSPGTPTSPSTAGTKPPTDPLVQADNLLESAQSHCERGAHQFLRDGECAAQTAAALKAFRQVALISRTEMDKFEAEAREAERKRRERARLDDLSSAGNRLGTGERGGLSPEVEVGSGLLEVGGSDDEDEDGEFEMPVPPAARFRPMAST